MINGSVRVSATFGVAGSGVVCGVASASMVRGPAASSRTSSTAGGSGAVTTGLVASNVSTGGVGGAAGGCATCPVGRSSVVRGASGTDGGAATAGRCCVTIGAAWRGWGTIMRGFGGSAAGPSVRAVGGGAVGRAAGGGFTGRAAGGGVADFGGAGGASVCGPCFARSRIARMSPGLETCEKSNFGFRSSPSRGALRCCPLLRWDFWMKARTRSASSTSMELECVFFSVTPTWGSASRIALLFTSSSLARSLIRIFCCIRLFLFPPNMPSDAHVTSSRIRFSQS